MNSPIRSARSLARLGIAFSLAFAPAAAWAVPVTLSSGHVDIFEAEYELLAGEPELHLGVHAGEDPGTHYEPGEVILEVKNAAYASTAGLPTAITDILGPNAWILPADLETAGELGVLEAGIGRVGDFPDASAVTFTLVSAGASNPGNFVLFNAGNPNQIRLSASGGTVGTNSFTLSQSHLHWNWGFSAPGTYTFDMQASYTDPGFGPLQSAVGVYTFQVVPEPSTWAVAGTAVLGAIGLRRRFRRGI